MTRLLLDFPYGVFENLMGGNGPIRRTITVVNPLGLHYRPAQLVAETAKQFRSRITVWNGTNKADGTSLVELILLVALPGADLVLEVDGDDADQAAHAVAEILASPGEGI